MRIDVGGDIPLPRGYHTTVFHDSRLFIYGGSADAQIFNDLYILELGIHAYLALHPAKIA